MKILNPHVSGGQFCFRLESENMKEVVLLMAICPRINSPVETFGSLVEGFAYAWVFIPIFKQGNETSVSFRNRKARKR